jgi:hypothetical protein
MTPMTSSSLLLVAFLCASVRMKSAFAFVSPPATFAFGRVGQTAGCEPSVDQNNVAGSHKSKSKSNTNNNNYKNRNSNQMTTIYMTATTSMVGRTNGTSSSITTPLPETGGRVLGNGSKDEVVQAIVPFGGSAPPVPNPNKSILGGKGLGLQEMSSIGIAVPPGFTLTTPLCQVFQESNDLSQEMWAEVQLAIQTVEADMGRKFGDAENPLLFSCRSGAAVSMPGMMDTVLNIVSTVHCHCTFDHHFVFQFMLISRYFSNRFNINIHMITGPQQKVRRGLGNCHQQQTLCLRFLPSPLGHVW